MRSYFPIVRWVLVAQAAAALLSALVAGLLSGPLAALSAVVGGLGALVPNIGFSQSFGVRDDRRTARQVVRAFYRGELIKLLLAVVFFGIVFSLPGLRADALLGGFVFTLSVFWFALLVRSKNL